jgi:hypothetical protein
VGKASYWSSVICSQSTLEPNRGQQAALLLLLVQSSHMRTPTRQARLHHGAEANTNMVRPSIDRACAVVDRQLGGLVIGAPLGDRARVGCRNERL